MIYRANNDVKTKLLPMFKNMNDTVILSCLQGYMGSAWVNHLENPTAAQLIIGNLVAYAGDPYVNEAEELLYNISSDQLVIFDTLTWEKQFRIVHQGLIEKVKRYRFRKNPNDLDLKYLQQLSKLPEGYELHRIDKTLVFEPSLHELSEDFTALFKDLKDYINRGIGYAILYHGQVVSAASSYSIYDQGIEIELRTHPAHRNIGLATTAASTLITTCIGEGLYPSWDAANMASVHLAEKLGYVLKESYHAYSIHL